MTSPFSSTQLSPLGSCSIYPPHVRAPGILLYGWASRDLLICDPCANEGITVGFGGEILLWGWWEQKVVQAVGLHKCDTKPQALDFGVWVRKRIERQVVENVGQIFIISWSMCIWCSFTVQTNAMVWSIFTINVHNLYLYIYSYATTFIHLLKAGPVHIFSLLVITLPLRNLLLYH